MQVSRIKTCISEDILWVQYVVHFPATLVCNRSNFFYFIYARKASQIFIKDSLIYYYAVFGKTSKLVSFRPSIKKQFFLKTICRALFNKQQVSFNIVFAVLRNVLSWSFLDQTAWLKLSLNFKWKYSSMRSECFGQRNLQFPKKNNQRQFFLARNSESTL